MGYQWDIDMRCGISLWTFNISIWSSWMSIWDGDIDMGDDSTDTVILVIEMGDHVTLIPPHFHLSPPRPTPPTSP